MQGMGMGEGERAVKDPCPAQGGRQGGRYCVTSTGSLKDNWRGKAGHWRQRSGKHPGMRLNSCLALGPP